MESPAEPTPFLSIRVGAIVQGGGVVCEGCGPGHQQEPPHPQPNCRFLALVYMPVMRQAPPGMAHAIPFIGGPCTPPIEINGVQMADNPAAQQLLRFLHWN